MLAGILSLLLKAPIISAIHLCLHRKRDMPRQKEFTDVVCKLWESFPNEAIVIDRQSGMFSDKDKVTAINHSGEFFSVKGPITLPAHRSGTPPLFQAGASDIGRNFASSVADAIFAAMPDIESGVELRNDLRKERQSRDVIRMPSEFCRAYIFPG